MMRVVRTISSVYSNVWNKACRNSADICGRKEGREERRDRGKKRFGVGDCFLVTFPEVNLFLGNALWDNGMLLNLTVPRTL